MKHVSKTEAEHAHLTISPDRPPIETVEPGETFAVETYDYVGDVLDEETPMEAVWGTDELADNINPVTGPIEVEDASPGDTLAIEIVDIELPDRGVINVFPGFGGLEGAVFNLSEPSDPHTTFCDIDDGTVTYPLEDGTEIEFPTHPQVGTIGTAEKHESIYSVKPHAHGGNMDCKDVTVGNTLYLPVDVDGGYLYLGDCHAAQGDGEICGISVEVPAVVTLRVEVIEDYEISWPRIESEDELMTVAAARPAEDAAKLAYKELIGWLVTEYDFTETDAYQLCSAVGRARLAQLVNPQYTVAAKFPKELL
ncbi:acetamidase/formamidase family protein [Salinigranum marinum]|uniref:acetamidase/formamidase family protein n=1 Tax=Salinigranum marinum TaxID=1515595 RepID=UPI002989B980|nr:acetamidase/formamidase family protein [Salinigranum marinum]